jgi:hypothetical protein
MEMDSGEQRLKALGYKQELKRGSFRCRRFMPCRVLFAIQPSHMVYAAADFTLVSNAAISFSIISTLTGVTGSLPIAFSNGGAPTAVWGWILVAGMTMTVRLPPQDVWACP